jgi:SAM-dependent methyltransferase
MDVLELNKKAWEAVGERLASYSFTKEKYKEMFNLFCNNVKSGKILDLGCGNGLPITKELVKRGFNVVGLDISEKMIKSAKKNVAGAEFICLSMTDIDFDGEFDGIIATYSLLCLDPVNFKKTAMKIFKALKKEGYFFLSLNEPNPDHKEEENLTELYGEKMYSRPYTAEEIREIFKDFKILKLEREEIRSKEYGVEHSLMVLMRK